MENKNLKELENKIIKLVKDFSRIKFKKNKFIPGETAIPASGKVIDGLEIEKLVSSSLDGWLTTGRFNKEFQNSLARFLKVKSLITVNSGSSANMIAFSSLTSKLHKEKAIKAGDEVITVAAGFPTTVNPIIQNGAIPVFVDVKLSTYNIDENLIESAITKKTKAIMLAHTLGNPFNLKVVREICDKYNLWLVEDNCDALGSKFGGQLTGTFGDVATLSFYPAHHITMGEGGAVFTNNYRIKRIAESFRDWGRDCYCEPGEENTCKKRFEWKLGELPEGYDHKYIYSHIGYNMKITDMQAACGLAQLNKLEKFIIKRKKNFEYLKKELSELDDILILPEKEIDSDPSWFGFPISLKDNLKIARRDLIYGLNENKIGTRLLFSGNLTKQPAYIGKTFKVSGNLQNTDFVMQNTFWIGLYPALGEEELSFVANTIKKLIKK